MRALLVLAPAPAAPRRASGRPPPSSKTTTRLGRRDGTRGASRSGAGLASPMALPCRWDRVGARVKRSPIAASLRASASAAEGAGGRGGGGGPEDEARRVGKRKVGRKGGVVRKLPRSPRVPWEERFEQLRAYHEIHGHTRVRQGEDYKLACWVSYQRERYRRGEVGRGPAEKVGVAWFRFRHRLTAARGPGPRALGRSGSSSSGRTTRSMGTLGCRGGRMRSCLVGLCFSKNSTSVAN
jgi:hypothetical protein